MLYVKEYIFRGRRRARGKERRITLLVTLCAAVILLVAADLISKAAAVSVLSQTGGALEFIPGLIRFEYHKNTGMAWGLFSNATWVFVVITIVTGGLIVFVLLKTLKTMPRNLQLGLALVLSGAIGNLIDRVALGYVRDFIAFDFINFPVFNFADSCITVGAVLLIVSVLFTKSGRAYFAALDEKSRNPKNGRRKKRGLRSGQRRRSGCRTRRKTGGKQMNSDSERMNGHLPEKDSGECAEKACENADDRDFGSEFVSDEILCGETEDDCRNGGKIVIAAQKNGGRLDAFAAEHTELTRSAVQRLLLCGAVTVNGRSEKAKYAVRMGDIIEIQLPPPVPTELVPQDIPIDIVYQDADIAVINKPVGMVVHPAPGNPDGTLCNALMFHLKDLSGIGGAMRPGLVHRIDKNTSGLLVIAKNDDAHNFLANELKTHSVARTYCALCEGNFRQDSGTVDAPLARHKTDRKRMAVYPAGTAGAREAVTHWFVRERFPNSGAGGRTLLRVELETGRTHQIRVHMAYINHPLVGDDVYGTGAASAVRGRNDLGFAGQALHAERLRLIHPRTHEQMEFFAPLPEHFKAALEKLRGANG